MNLLARVACATLMLSNCVAAVSENPARARLLDGLVTTVDASAAGNIAVAPSAAEEVVALLALGAAGNTQDQLVSTLSRGKTISRITDQMSSDATSLHDEVSSKNELWIDGLTWNQTYVTRAASLFDVQITTGNPPLLASMPGGQFAVANTASFVAKWQRPFNATDTRAAAFYSGGRKYSVPTMNRWVFASYSENGPFSYVVLPMQNGWSMLIALPKAKDGKPSLRAAIGLLANQAAYNAGKNVRIALPRFSFDSQIDIRKALRNAGIDTDSSKVDFSPMYGRPSVGLGSVIQETHVSVAEGSGTPGPMNVGLGRTWRMRVDHPFAFVVFRPKDRLIILAGIVDRP